MSLERDLRHGSQVARAEFRRSVRQYTGDWRRLLGLVIAGVFVGGGLLVTVPSVYVLGRAARSVSAIPFFGPVATVVPALLVVLAAFRTVERIGGVDTEALLLTTVHPRAVVVGLIGSEVARLAAWFGVPLAATVAAFALGVGSPTFPITAAAIAAPTLCWAAVWGYALGLGLLRVLRRLPRLRRVLKWLGVAALLVAIAGSQLVGQFVADGAVPVGVAVDTVTFAPVTEYVALAFVGTPLSQPTSLQAVAVLVGIVCLTPVGLAVATRQASALWFTDANTGSTGERTAIGGFDVPRPFAAAAAGRIAWGHLVRAARHPQELSHLVLVVFFIGPLGSVFLQSSGDALGVLVAGSGVGLATYLAGAAFGLNPLGDDRPQLPLVLLAGVDPRTVIRGRVLAGVAVGLPVAVVVPAVGAGLGAPPAVAAAFAAVGGLLCVTAATFAVGIGTAYPVYEEREFWGSETVVPSKLVMLTYLAVVSGGTAIGLVITWYGRSGLTLTPAIAAGLAAYVLLTLGIPYGCYRYSVRRYDQYTFE
jgi:hypothetical protein